ncbi:ABC transporter ATP-binding protein [Salinarchaeum sp. IM2453]|uniref:ABC transporter ATP-binding protein n=1 Tax=Salinarchaeum sp. IM2453 TaxID=2862870 RepID=UPI001C82A68F|nr:ABC transporter ATP-binding protein [Salinarchaeum sp. IM2453]QZA87962.1 ABC transporter ATP-binding protein [Salinarchaeum sp. IM2453]
MTSEYTSNQPLLTAESITHNYGNVEALSDCTLSLHTGRVYGLIGPNGAGKTTLLQILCGLLSPDKGTIHINSNSSRAIGYLPQHPEFRPQFTAREIIQFYQQMVGQNKSSPVSILEQVGLDSVASRTVDGFSGGMIQLLGIAQATIGNPPIIILDEPTSGLDPTMTTRVFEATETIADEHTTVLVSSHDLDSVDRYANRVLLLINGQIKHRGTTDALQDRTNVQSLHQAYHDLIPASHETVTP